jgi:quercetin dioxygenase-like cupin family protein
MKILSSKDRPSKKGPAAWFTGNVWIDEIAVGAEPSRIRFFWLNFGPGARTAWHTHPLGQVLHVLTGSGLVQVEGGPVEEIHPGDTVQIGPDVRHWHGAGPHHSLIHQALQEGDAQGVDVVWLEPVTDEEYGTK